MTNHGGSKSDTLREELEKAADGLDYASESFNPFQFFTLPAEGENDLTPEGFLSHLGISQAVIDEFNLPVERLIEERPLENFFPSAGDLADRDGKETSDPEVMAQAKKYRELEASLKKRLRGLKALCVGQVEIRCYLVGLDERGYLAGLVTLAVET